MSAVRPQTPLESSAPKPRTSVLAPFRSRDYRLLWSGLIISNLGTWMQLTTLGYLVVKLAGSAKLASLDVGILGASSAVPVMLFSPLAGVIADRYPRRQVLFVTNGLEVCFALALAILTSTHRIALWEIFMIAGLRSTGQSFDAPARQSWVPLLVPRENLGNAIGLNSVAFNAPSIVGPPVAGVLILSVGIATSFYVNAVATLAVVVALVFMRPVAPSSSVRENVLASILAGVRFLWNDRVLRSVLLLLVVTALLVRPYSQLMPAYAAHVVHVDARGLGLLLAASGSGAIIGSIATAVLGTHRRGSVWFASAMLLATGTIVLGSVHVFAISFVVLVFIGFAVMSFAGNSNVLLQTLSPDDMRGRAISVFSMIILGLVPAGSLLLGTVASFVGLPASLIAGGVLALIISAVVWMGNPQLRTV
ncbi:MAG: MFS transporter [Candidatus Eremiobacteraeota bacterium]|nr:MFS transporter [Candidatus Eremiobacteraeota bacterium]MBC5801685.1 MFS transporter [Candidatus Eremiobacteraeota bacterium]MBC5820450.1 MFS transporter [Candidatus Eremiobacteraeota bacterium]